MASATKRQTFDQIADGTALTATSQTSTSGDQVSGLGGTGTKTVQTSSGVRGNGLHIEGVGVSSFVTWTFTAVSAVGAEHYFVYDPAVTAPTADQQILQLRNASAGVLAANWRTSKIIRITDNAGTVVNDLNLAAELPAGRYRLFIAASKGTTTSNGRIVYSLDNAATGTNIDLFDSSTQNTGTADYTEARNGKGNGGGTGTWDFDDMAYRSGDVQIIDLLGLPIGKQPIARRAAVTRAANY